MDGAQPFGQLHVFRGVQARETARADGADDGVGDVVVVEAQQARADAESGEIDVFAAVDIGDAAALGGSEVGRIDVRSHHFRAFAQKSGPSRNECFCAAVQFLIGHDDILSCFRDGFMRRPVFFSSLLYPAFPGSANGGNYKKK